MIDYPRDSGCSSANDTYELVPACSDGKDNDRDGTVDEDDLGCASGFDNDERLRSVPTLLVIKAETHAATVLRDDFRSYGRDKRKRKTCRRVTRTRVRCRVKWASGPRVFSGVVTIWHSREGEKVDWNYAYRIRRTGGGKPRTFVVT
jgi:hypothetical protein